MNKKNIIRHDYVTRSIIILIDELKFNDNLKWLNYEEFISYLKKVINEYETNLNQNEVPNYMDIGNDLDNTEKIQNENDNQNVHNREEESEMSEEDNINRILKIII